MNNNFIEIKPTDIERNTFTQIGKEYMLITAKKDESINTMTASWGGLGVMWNKNVAYIVVRPQRYTKEFVDFSDHFSLCFFNGEIKDKLAYLGTVSGRDEDKIAKAGLTSICEDNIPYFEEAKLVLFCKKLFATDIKEDNFIDKDIMNKNYPNKDFHTLYIGEITKVLKKTK